MDDNGLVRFTLSSADQSEPFLKWKPKLADFGKRRHLCYSLDFDTRAFLFEEPEANSTDEVRRLFIDGRERVKLTLADDFGPKDIEQKVENFIAIGTRPWSIVGYHNFFHHQIRRAFIIGAYYPALLGACALGERILNHLVLDLREYYRSSEHYPKVRKKSSFDNWKVAIDALEEWQVLLPKSVLEFRALMLLRHRSIHFNASTYQTSQEDALAAIHHIREIIDQQFTAFGDRPWFIRGTLGKIFIKREWEENPFVKTYYLRSCPFVGPYFSISFESGLQYLDFDDYGDGVLSDEEFAETYNSRLPEQIFQARP